MKQLFAMLPAVCAVAAWAGFRASHASSSSRTAIDVGLYAYIAGSTIVTLVALRQGYLRRRPHWTRESWRRFAMASTLFVSAIVASFAMLEVLDLRLPMVGAPHSFVRGLWVWGVMVSMLFGGCGLGIVLWWLSRAPASQPFTWSFRRFWSYPKPGAGGGSGAT